MAVHAYETWGFSDLSNELLDTLNIWAEFVYGPLLEDRPRKIQETDGTMYGAQVAGKVHAELRRLGGVTPPARIRPHGPGGKWTGIRVLAPKS